MFLILRSWVYFEFKCRVSFDFFFLNSWIIHGFLLKTMWDVFLYMVLLWKLCMMSFGEKNINYTRFLIKKLCMLTVFIHSWKTVWNLATLLYTTFVDTVQKLCRISFFTVISSVFCINECLWKFGLKVTVSNPRLMKNFYFILISHASGQEGELQIDFRSYGLTTLETNCNCMGQRIDTTNLLWLRYISQSSKMDLQNFQLVDLPLAS